jgi:hypothetical protein
MPVARRIGRILLLLAVALGLAPGTWMRTSHEAAPLDERQILEVTPLALETARAGELEVAGAWRLASPNHHFGGFSALLALPDGTLFAASDGGRQLRFAPPGRPPGPAHMDYFAGCAPVVDKPYGDVEALTRDPVSGKVWATCERRNRIVRYDSQFRPEAWIDPAAIRDWPTNAGPESIVRLADGRFILLSEGSPRWFARELPALLYSGDPVTGVEPLRFGFVPPRGYRPVDAASMPDGRVMILLRRGRWSLPPVFAAKLVVADPAGITEGRQWTFEVVAEIDAPLPTDNYEGLAVEVLEDGSTVLWLISDDNRVGYQRTLLLKLVWPSNEKARGSSRALS